MNTVLHLLSRYGYLIVFGSMLLESVGIPIPAVPFLIAGGAACALGTMNPGGTILSAIVAGLMGDTLLYFLGRKAGWWVLGLLCRVSANPETCILRSAQSFYKRGRITLVIAKYIPGINTMAPPLAGSLKMRLKQFLALDFLGGLLYILPFFALGYFFSRQIEYIIRSLHTVSQIVLGLLVLAVIGYAIYRIRIYYKHRLYRTVPRTTVQALVKKLADPESDGKILIADVRSHGYYDSGTKRIKGSFRLEPASIEDQLHKLPKDREIYLYCT
ncbi:MAG: VTT domain-containing protein [Acidobacteriia bacterium]|nr:VTT domain-containing protein [Terriglobia bacterium]